IYGFLLLLLGGHEEKAPRFEVIAMLLVGVISLETLLNGVFYLRRQHEDVVISGYDSYHDFYDVYDDVFDYVKEHDTTPFFRMDKTFQRTVCDSFVLGYRGLASSTSTLNASVVKLQHQLGMKANSHWTEATGSTIVTNSFLGVKYWVAKSGESVDPLYAEYHKAGEGDTATVTYHNPYALPLVFASAGLSELSLAMPRDQVDYHYDDATKTWVLNEEWSDTLWSPFTRMNAIYASLTGDSSLSVYDPITATVTTKGGMDKEGITWSHDVYKCLSGSAAARIVFTFEAPTDGSPVYCYFPTKYSREAQLYVNGERFGDTVFYPAHANVASVTCLGSFELGETVTVELSLGEGNEFYLVAGTPYFYTVDEADLSRATELLRRGGLTMTRADDDHFVGTLTAAEGFTSVQTTIPYDAGWRILVNGERTEGYVTADALLAFDLPAAGTYEIELIYRPAIYTAGLLVSIGGSLLLLGVITLIVLRRRGVLVFKKKTRLVRAVEFFLPEAEVPVTETAKESAEPPVPGQRISGHKPKHASKGKRRK
ncbi:MAG: YfhO family protein, partial [Clostridia bacterium]|nr:YfhO family protein [Clostridia bacterium]